jgi:hypothetical protein
MRVKSNDLRDGIIAVGNKGNKIQENHIKIIEINDGTIEGMIAMKTMEENGFNSISGKLIEMHEAQNKHSDKR